MTKVKSIVTVTLVALTLPTVGLAQQDPSVLLHDEAQKLYKETLKALEAANPGADPSTYIDVEIDPITDFNKLREMTDEIEADPDNQAIFNTPWIVDKFIAVKKTVGLEHVAGEDYTCSRVQKLFVGQRRYVDYMPFCYRNRLYPKDGENTCKAVRTTIGDGKPGSGDNHKPIQIGAAHVAVQSEINSVRSIDYVCTANQ